ncbi:hypothetical protein PEX1_027220 [Penicillium expansum]|uniref:DUF7702 domain-containing protein n=1 Tax=Penicillium expansum TaxID=27334 RepID=A0A0A2KGA6_PENEN|nr:hypothetical protein PEX2_011840 [Penicillium expansum]KGO40697.1 hypothetical protein PEXP_071960 [Penicillium expansum]KGO63395.1 hypothetical protein PEX2_011840 [Penicillium expansum]KGO70792.1 hypothetical protein PEX1_027220 [Penicillium expansum]
MVQFIFFVPSAVYAIWLCFRYGLKAAGTWRFIATLSLLRIAGSISYFVSLRSPGLHVIVSVVVCELSGLAPLMLVCVALVGRVNKTAKVFPGKAAIGISLLSLLGLILGIVGTDRALEDAKTTDEIHVNSLTRAALALFLVGFTLMLVSYFALVQDVLRHPAKRAVLGTEACILAIVGLAAPFVFIRLLYSALGDFTGAELWSSVSGNDTVYLIMDVLMEIIAISIMYTTVYFAPLPKDPPAERITDAERGDTDELHESRESASPSVVELGSKR